MALAKEPTLEGSQTCALYHGNVQELDPSSLEWFSYKGHNRVLVEDGKDSESFGRYSGGFLPMLSDPSNSSSGSFVFESVDSSPQEAYSIVNFKATSNHWACSGSSVLSFEQGDHESAIWMDAMEQNYQTNHFDMKLCTESRLIQDQSCFDVESGYKLKSNAMNHDRQNKEQFGLLCLGASAGDCPQESAREQEKRIQKRPYMDGDHLQASKKHCSNTRKTKAKPSPSKDPQSIAAKNRRERISERLKVLQDLVPNGWKVDLVTMLEKAISYVKFLQLQVKVLATDEFWPVQGGKAPEVSQVKEAIDAILSSHRNGNSSS